MEPRSGLSQCFHTLESVRTAARMKLAGEEIGERKSQSEATAPDQMGGDGVWAAQRPWGR